MIVFPLLAVAQVTAIRDEQSLIKALLDANAEQGAVIRLLVTDRPTVAPTETCWSVRVPRDAWVQHDSGMRH